MKQKGGGNRGKHSTPSESFEENRMMQRDKEIEIENINFSSFKYAGKKHEKQNNKFSLQLDSVSFLVLFLNKTKRNSNTKV